MGVSKKMRCKRILYIWTCDFPFETWLYTEVFEITSVGQVFHIVQNIIDILCQMLTQKD